ncbi:AAA family ATPase, partial [uncultured Methanobrevibacter sp.]|uniref:AAA family ATPase n=1 Tax=uncultured Methanobrevibacter sp. TaxID=253161 RepID=UPI00262F63EC
MANMWMVRAGERSFLIDEFLKNSIVAIGWDLGDLSDKSDDEIAGLFKKKYKNLRSLNQVLRFKNEINIGDYVLSAKGGTRTYFIGKIISDYKRAYIINQKDSSGDNYFDIRDVEWLGEVQRDSLKKSTQGTVGANNTVFNINDDAKNDVLKVCRDNMDSIDKSACIIRKYLDENNLDDFSQKDVDDIFIKFKKQFGPDVLEKLEGPDILNKIFLHDGDNSTLCYNLEYVSEFNRGGIGGGFASKYSLYKSKDTHEWKAGSSKTLKVVSETEAINIASKIRDAIVKGAKHIENTKLESISDYFGLENDLKNIFKDCIVKPTSNWIHKYYVLIFPDKFPEVHGNDMRNFMLQKFRIEPEKGYYVNDGKYYQLAKKAGIKMYSLFSEEIIGLFFEGNVWDPIEKGKLIDLDDCDFKPPVLIQKRNSIYFGAPGTGKSFDLNIDKNNLLKNNENNYERVTFHPDYSYANFVGTYKPVPVGDSITYKYVPGPFMRILKKALQKPFEPFLLIIEEINRANVAATFGDVFQLLDRDENYESEYPIDASEDAKDYLNKDKIKLPSNLFIWATMNSADQGVFPMDTAFKRRWDFKYFSINHNEGLIEDTNVNLNNINVKWNDLRKAINDELLSYKINEDKCIGPFFAFTEFMNKEIPTETFKDIFK